MNETMQGQEQQSSPVPEVLESAALSIGSMIEPLPAPEYVKQSAQSLVDALNRWASELRGPNVNA